MLTPQGKDEALNITNMYTPQAIETSSISYKDN